VEQREDVDGYNVSRRRSILIARQGGRTSFGNARINLMPWARRGDVQSTGPLRVVRFATSQARYGSQHNTPCIPRSPILICPIQCIRTSERPAVSHLL
jgi:hypothetical protein